MQRMQSTRPAEHKHLKKVYVCEDTSGGLPCCKVICKLCSEEFEEKKVCLECFVAAKNRIRVKYSSVIATDIDRPVSLLGSPLSEN